MNILLILQDPAWVSFTEPSNSILIAATPPLLDDSGLSFRIPAVGLHTEWQAMAMLTAGTSPLEVSDNLQCES